MLNCKSLFKYFIWFLLISSTYIIIEIVVTSYPEGLNFLTLTSIVESLIPHVPQKSLSSSEVGHFAFFFLILYIWIYCFLAMLNNYFD